MINYPKVGMKVKCNISLRLSFQPNFNFNECRGVIIEIMHRDIHPSQMCLGVRFDDPLISRLTMCPSELDALDEFSPEELDRLRREEHANKYL